jgi:hypothetical protein
MAAGTVNGVRDVFKDKVQVNFILLRDRYQKK